MEQFEVPTNRDKETVKLYSKLIIEELKELEAEFDTKPSHDELKEAVDLLWVTLGKIAALGYTESQIQHALIEVFESNMSKLCDNEEEAIDFVNATENASYKKNSAGKFIIFNTNTNKVLKGPKYNYAKLNTIKL